MAVLYVASDDRGAGKTAFCAGLAHLLRQQGKRAAVLKPLGDPDDPDVPMYRNLLGQAETDEPRRVPRAGLTSTLLDDLKAAADEATDGQDVLIVEGTSDLSAKDSMQVADALDARVAVVVGFRPRLGTRNLTRLRTLFGDRLLGYVINGVTRYQGNDVSSNLLPAMESRGLASLGVIPEDRSLLGVTVGQVASHLKGRYVVGEVLADSLVQHFLVGGFGMDSGLEYFGLRDNKAVIVRGDRPDVQMAALQTPTTCMVLTKGIEPIEYVLNEAELEEVPVVVVESNTLDTMAALSAVQDLARFDHPAKLARYVELLEEHVDVGAILSGFGMAA